MKRTLTALLVFTLIALGAPRLTFAQANGTCPMTLSVVAGDTLSKIAARFLGDSQAYPQIVDITNSLAANDTAFSKIDNPNLISPGEHLCVPDVSGAPPELALHSLANATYRSDLGQSGTVTLKNGTYSQEAAPGSASKNTVQLFWLAYGKLGGLDTALVVTWSNGGGSGTFYDVHVMQIQNGQPTDIATSTLGDRILVQSVNVKNDIITVNYLDRRPNEPMVAVPTVPVTKTWMLQSGQLVEANTATTSAFPGTYYEFLPGADSSGRIVLLVMATDGHALLATQFIGKGGPLLEEGTWTEEGNQARVQVGTASGGSSVENFVFDLQGDQLVASQYDTSTWGSQGLTLKKVGADSLAGVYRVTEPAADAPQLVEVLFLGPEGTAVMSSDYVGKLVRIDAGKWTQAGNQATVTFTQEDGNPINNTTVFQFQDGQLVGPHGFTLTRLPASAHITGTLTFAEHIGIPYDSVISVQLVDISIRNAPAVVLAETSFTSNGRPLPFPYDLGYDPTLIAFNHTYALQATITVNGDVLFRTTSPYLVLTNGNPTEVDMTLDKVG